jgi:hypothetical protein
MDKRFVRTAIVSAVAFVAYRAYKLWELANSFSYRVSGLYFVKPKKLKDVLNKFELVVEYTIMNPTTTTFPLNGAFGGIYYKNVLLGTFKVPAFKIGAGDTPIKAGVLITPQNAAELAKDITNKNFPVFDIRMTAILPFGFKQKMEFKVDSKDYLPENTFGFFNIFK